MEAGSCQPLAKSKGVHREVESEGSWRQSSGRRNTNIIRHKPQDEFAKQNEVLSTARMRLVYMMPVYGMKVMRLTVGDLTDVLKQSMKHG
jgi:hypothetical protein